MFAAPVMYKSGTGNYEVIDNSLVATAGEYETAGYLQQNKSNEIKTYFPQTLGTDFLIERQADKFTFGFSGGSDEFTRMQHVHFKNMYGDYVDTVKYAKADNSMTVYCYPTKAGIRTEIVLDRQPEENKITLHIGLADCTAENKGNGYITLQRAGGNIGMIYSPVIRSADGQISCSSTMEIQQTGTGKLDLQIILPGAFLSGDVKYPVRADVSFEFYQNKMPDTGVFADKQNMNAYLLHYSQIGSSELLGESWQYLRYRFNYFFQTSEDSIISSTYHIRELTGDNTPFEAELGQVRSDWSSVRMVWADRKTDYEPLLSKKIVGGAWNEFDITEFTRQCVADMDWVTEVNGLLLKAKTGQSGYRLFASSDNSLYTPYIEIHLTSAPEFFKGHDNINPPIN